MTEKIILLFANPYSFEDSKTGKLIEGISTQYIMGDNLKSSHNDDGTKGYLVTKSSLPMSVANKIKNVPGLYNADFVPYQTSKGLSIKIEDVTYIKDI